MRKKNLENKTLSFNFLKVQKTIKVREDIHFCLSTPSITKIVKLEQSYMYINGHLPYHCPLKYLARARCMTWHANLRAQ